MVYFAEGLCLDTINSIKSSWASVFPMSELPYIFFLFSNSISNHVTLSNATVMTKHLRSIHWANPDTRVHLLYNQAIMKYDKAWIVCMFFLAATSSLMNGIPSVCPSVCPSHLFDYVPIIVSSWNFQDLLPMTKVMSMQKVKVRGQMSRSERS